MSTFITREDGYFALTKPEIGSLVEAIDKLIDNGNK